MMQDSPGRFTGVARPWGVLPAFALSCALTLASPPAWGQEPEAKPKPADPNVEYIRKLIPEKIAGEYQGGRLKPLEVAGRMAYVVEPTGPVDPERRWIWIFPFWLGIQDGHGAVHHRWYVERYLAKGFHVAGINVGTSCGSPKAAEVCQTFYEQVREQFRLHPRARLLVQSNGGLIGYGWAVRHPQHVERIGGVCPATDFRTWPGLYNVTQFPEKGLDYGLGMAELTERIAEFNPIDLLAPLAREQVRLLHIHGDADDLVPMKENSTELARRYGDLGGSARIVVLEGLGHGGQVLYESQPLLDFLLEDCESLGWPTSDTGASYVARVEVWGYESISEDGGDVEDRLLRSIELAVEPGRPFFAKSKSEQTTLELRGRVASRDESREVEVSILATLRKSSPGLDEGPGHEDRTAAKTSVVVTVGQTIVLGGMESRVESEGTRGATRTKLQIRFTLIHPCAADSPRE